MCGIIASFNTSPNKKTQPADANQYIIDQFEDQHTRGVKGFGIINIAKDMEIEIFRACETTKFLLDLYMNKSNMIIAHHRTPTSTDNKLDQTHPMYISNDILKYDYLIIHNGVVSNDKELYKKHEELGFLYRTEYIETWGTKYQTSKFNDSESIAIELALFIETKTSIIGTTNKAAFIALQLDKKTEKAITVFFGKNKDGDLNIERTDNTLNISSEGVGEEIKENIMFSFNPNDPKMTLTQTPMPFEEKKETPITVTNHYGGVMNRSDVGQWKSGREYDKVKQVWFDPPKEEIKETNAIEIKEEPELEAISIIGKNYITTTCIKFKELIRTMGSTELSHVIDDELDKQSGQIEELVEEYKEYILTNHTDKEVEEFYTNQISQVMKAMKAIGNIANKQFMETEIMESQYQAEIEDRNPYGLTIIPGNEERNNNLMHQKTPYQTEIGF